MEGFGMMISCNLMANGFRPFKKSKKKSYSVCWSEVDSGLVLVIA